MKKTIIHMDLDTFFVSVERLMDSRLNKKPILVGGVTDRGVVAACSYEARSFGIHSAMPMRLAKRLCPEAIVIKGNSHNYMKYSDMVTNIVKENVPVFEKTSVDEFYADLTGMDQFFGCFKMASELRDTILKETGLPISFGLSSNKTVSKIATGQAKPDNKIEVKPGEEKVFLAPLSVKKIPMVGLKTYQTLRNLGVQYIKTVQEMPMHMMEQVLGKSGKRIWQKASGIDNTPVIPYSTRKSVSSERTFDKDTIDMVKLRGVITAIAENLAFQLRKNRRVTGCVNIKIRYSDFNTYTLQKRIPYTNADHTIIPLALELFKKLYNRRLLIRLIGVRCSHLVQGSYQMDMFNDNSQIIKLYHAMDDIRIRYGDKAVIRASGIDAKINGRHNPFNAD